MDGLAKACMLQSTAIFHIIYQALKFQYLIPVENTVLRAKTALMKTAFRKWNVNNSPPSDCN